MVITTPRVRSVDHLGRGELVVTNDRLIPKAEDADIRQEDSSLSDDHGFYSSSDDTPSMVSYIPMEDVNEQLANHNSNTPEVAEGPHALSGDGPPAAIRPRNRHPQHVLYRW